MDVHSRVLDAYVKTLSTAALHDSLRTLQVLTRAASTKLTELDAHESAFARAYRVKRADGTMACLRLWKSVPPDSAYLTLYAAIEGAQDLCVSAALPRTSLICQAITVKGTVIPAVVMDWIDGMTLGDYVHAHAADSEALTGTADALLQLFRRQNEAGISHGDLRASNILIRPNGSGVDVAMIDLDSLRWRGGPTLPRTIGGNDVWREVRKRHSVTTLADDYLDQAMTYLSIQAVAQDRTLWSQSTDDFLMVDILQAERTLLLRKLEGLPNPTGRIAYTVRKVLEGDAAWDDLRSAMAGEPAVALDFWMKARTLAAGAAARPTPKPVPPPAQPAPPPVARPVPTPAHPPVAGAAPAPRPAAPRSQPAHPAAPRQTYAGRAATRRQQQLRRWALAILAIILVLFGVGLYILWRSGPGSPSRRVVCLTAAPARSPRHQPRVGVAAAAGRLGHENAAAASRVT